jgi:hypothetical protein
MAKVDKSPVTYPNQATLTKTTPVGTYTLIGSSLVLLFSLVGCLTVFDSVQIDMDWFGNKEVLNAVASNSNKNIVASEIDEEIKVLQARISSLESEDRNVLAMIDNPSTQTISISIDNGEGIETGPSSVGFSSENGDLVAANLQVSAGNNSNMFRTASNEQLSALRTEDISSEESIFNQELQPVSAEAMTIDLAVADESIQKKSSEYEGMGGSNYSNSLKYRLAKLGRAMQRMMDNPVALKNSRDPHYHIPGMIVQDVNFGATGTLIAPRVQTMSRMQWFNASNELFSNQIAVDGYAFALRGGVGLQLNHSFYNRGGIQVSSAAFTYSPKLSVSRHVSVEPSIRFKMGNKMLNSSQMTGQTQVEIDRGNVLDYYADGTQPIGKSLWYRDLGLGLNVNTKWFFASLQADNLFKHRDNIYSTDINNPRKAGTQFVASIGADWVSRKENMSFSPYAIYHRNEQVSEAWLGANYRLGWFTIGGAVSSNLDPAASIGMKFKHFSLHYNADYSNSIMMQERSLSHQLTLRFLGKPSRMGQRILNL